MVQSLERSNSSRILFNSPELLEIQRAGFYNFLERGIAEELSKKFPIKVKSGSTTIELHLYEQNFKLVSPDENPKECILKMKTYSCKLYVKVQAYFYNCLKKVAYKTQPEWILLGQLPMMTKRGHFIINGSTRVIVHQIVRSPGIYFQKLLKKDENKKARFYGDIIPLKGVWLRLQMTKKGRLEARFKKGKKVQAELLQKCLQVIESQSSSIERKPLCVPSPPPCSLTPYPSPFGGQKRSFPPKGDGVRSGCEAFPAPLTSGAFPVPHAPLGARGKAPLVRGTGKAPLVRRTGQGAQAKLSPFGGPGKQACKKVIGVRTGRGRGEGRGTKLISPEEIALIPLTPYPSPFGGQKRSFPPEGDGVITYGERSGCEAYTAGVPVQDRKLRTYKASFTEGDTKGDQLYKQNLHRWNNTSKTCTAGVLAQSTYTKQSFVNRFLSRTPTVTNHFTYKNVTCTKRSFVTRFAGVTKRSFVYVYKPNKANFWFYKWSQRTTLKHKKFNSQQEFDQKKVFNENNVLDLTFLEKKESSLESKAEHDAFVHTYDKLYRTTEDRELEVRARQRSAKLQRKKKNFLSTSFALPLREISEAYNPSPSLPPCPPPCPVPVPHTSGAFPRRGTGKAPLVWGTGTGHGGRGMRNGGGGQASFMKGTNVIPAVQASLVTPEKGLRITSRERSKTKLHIISPNKQNLSKLQSEPLYLEPNKISNVNRRITNKACTSYKPNLYVTAPFGSTAFKIKKCSENLFSTFKMISRYSLGELGREKINSKFGLFTLDRQLTSLDIHAASNWLYKLRRGEKSIDDIDHSQNRRVRTSGEQIQMQFENGVERLQKVLLTKLQEWSSILEASAKVSQGNENFCKHLYYKQPFPVPLTSGAFPLALPHAPSPFGGHKRSFPPKGDGAGGHGRGQRGQGGGVPPKPKEPVQDLLSVPVWLTNRSFVNQKKQSFVHKESKALYGDQIKTLFLNPFSQSSLKELFSTKPINGALREFFGSNPLSQYMDQTNPLAEMTHKRRMSSLGIGGVSRESAGMAIRGIHPTHYGRICPIETPEGKNAGLVNSLAFYTKVDKNGFLETPYYQVFKGQVQSELGFSFCSAKKELLAGLQIAPSDLQQSWTNILRTNEFRADSVPIRVADYLLDIFKKTNSYKVDSIGVSPIQMISVATSLIPFLEHNDANRALMGSNMQRQAVPLMIAERPIIGTGLESLVVIESGHITQSSIAGFVSYVSATKIVVEHLLNFGEKTVVLDNSVDTHLRPRYFPYKQNLYGRQSPPLCLPLAPLQASLVSPLLRPPSGESSACTGHGLQASLVSPEGGRGKEAQACLYERSLSIQSTKLVNTLYKHFTLRVLNAKHYNSFNKPFLQTCLYPKLAYHLRKSKKKTRSKTKYSRLIESIHLLETFIRSNQNTCLTEKPLVRESDWVQKGDVLSDCSASNKGSLSVGKNILVAYIPWEGYNFEDAIVISERLVKEHVYTSLHIERYIFHAQDLKDGTEWFTRNLPGVTNTQVNHLNRFGLPKIGSFVKEGEILIGKIRYCNKKPASPYERLLVDILGEKNFSTRNQSLYVPKGVEARIINHRITSVFQSESENKVRPAGAAKTIHLFLGEKRIVQVGDKMSGRHGNKGVISTVLPKQDMPYLPDGTPIDIILNPLGVPSRMNVGQVLESLLGLAASYLKQDFKMTAFDELYGVEASQSLVYLKLYQARLQSQQNWLFQVDFPGKTRLVDGRSGECFSQWITVGKAYILKLIHMVTEKIHARGTGPYALITQQPLRGRSNKGGQRLGEMEVWALEGFGAAYTLQELLTKKSDDFWGRKEIVDSILPYPSLISDKLKPQQRTDYRIGQNRPLLGHPEIFKVLLCELQALCLDVGVYVLTRESFQRNFLGGVY